MKKVMAILMAAMMLVPAGCTKKNEQTAAGGSVPTLTWVTFGSKQEDLSSVLTEANKIIEPAIGAKLDLQFIDGSAYEERIKMYMASGNSFDICFTSNWLNDYQKAATSGGLMDITQYVENDAPGLKTAIPEYVLESAKIDGKLYGIPNVQVMTHPLSLNVDKTIAAKYDFDFSAVKKMNDIEPYLEMVKEGSPEVYPYKPLNMDMWVLPEYEFVVDESNVVIKKDGSSHKLMLQFDSDAFKTGLNTTRDWYLKGYIRQDVSSVGDDTTDVKMGKYAVDNGNWKPGAEATDLRPTEHIILHEPYLKRVGALQTMLAVGAKSKNPDKAVKLIELVNTNQALYNLLCFGIEGKHYNLVNNKVVAIEDSGYDPNSDWSFGNQFNAYVREGAPDDVWEQTQKMNDEAKKSPLLGFVPDLTPITNELSQISSVNEEFAIYKVGADDPQNYWDNYMKKLEVAGQQKVLDELQRQVDEFFAAK